MTSRQARASRSAVNTADRWKHTHNLSPGTPRPVHSQDHVVAGLLALGSTRFTYLPGTDPVACSGEALADDSCGGSPGFRVTLGTGFPFNPLIRGTFNDKQYRYEHCKRQAFTTKCAVAICFNHYIQWLVLFARHAVLSDDPRHNLDPQLSSVCASHYACNPPKAMAV